MMHHKLTAPLNWTAIVMIITQDCNCNDYCTRINTHFLNQKYTINYWATRASGSVPVIFSSLSTRHT